MGNGKLVIGVEGNMMPMVFNNDFGKLSGFDYEFAVEVCSRLGIDFEFKDINWDKKEEVLENKIVDCIWGGLSITEERRNKNIDFSFDYLVTKQVIVIKKEDASKYTNLESFVEAKITALIDSTSEKLIKSNEYLSKATYESSESVDSVLLNMLLGLYDAFVIDYTIAKAISEVVLFTEFIILEEIKFENEFYAIGFRHQSDMVKKINKIILDIMVDGTLGYIAEKYDLTEFYEPMIKTDSYYIMNKKEIIIGMDENYPPLSFYNSTGELIGFDIEFARIACQRLGLKPVFFNMIWDKREFELNSGIIDCIWNAVTVTEDRRKTMKFSHIYLTNKQVIVIKKKDKDKFNSWESLSDFNVKISAGINTTGEEAIKTNPYLSVAKYIPSRTTDDALIKLEKEMFDAIVIDHTVVKAVLSSGEYKDMMVIPGLELENEVYAASFRVNSDMTEKANEKILEMINDNTLLELAKKYDLVELYQAIEDVAGNSDDTYIMNKGEITIGIKRDNEPFSYMENEVLTGFDIEFSRTLFNKIGIDVKYIFIDDWSKKEEKLKSKEVDCIWNGLMNISDRTDNVRYSNLILNNKQAVVIHQSNSVKYSNLSKLSGAKIAVKKDSDGLKVGKTNIYLKQSKIYEIDSKENLIDLLQMQLYDAIIMDYLEAKKYMLNEENEHLIVLEVIDMINQEYAFSFRKNSDILKRINMINMEMFDDGTIFIIAMKYNLIDMYSLIDTSDLVNVLGTGKLIIGIDKGHIPMTYYDSQGELVGFDIEFAKEVCSRLGVEPSFYQINWNEKEKELNTKSVDCIWSALTITEQRRENIRFSRAYLKNRQIIIINKSDAEKYQDFTYFSKAKISAEIGSIGELAFYNSPYFSQSRYIGSNTFEEALYGLKKGTFNAVISDYTTGKTTIGKGEYSDLMVIENFILDENEYAVGFRIGSDLSRRVNDIIEELEKEKFLENIAKKFELSELLIGTEKSDLEYIMSNGKMIIGIDSNFMPMTYYYEDGELTGFDYDFAKEVCYRLGIDAVFKSINWDRKEEELENKSIDCIWSALTITEERLQKFSFSYDYLSNKQVVIIKKSDFSKYSNLENFENAKITFLIESPGENAIKEHANLSKAYYSATNDMDELLNCIEEGKYDVGVTDYIAAKAYMENDKYSDLMILDSIDLGKEVYGIGFRKNSDIPQKINFIMMDIMTDGSLYSIASSYNLIDLYLPMIKTDSYYIMNKKELIIGVQGIQPPMNYYDSNGELTGFDIEFAKSVCQKLGITPVFKIIDWNKKESEINTRNIDCIWSAMSVTEERRQNVKFSRVYMTNKQSIVINKVDSSRFTNLDSLSDFTVNISAGFNTIGEIALKSNPYLSEAKYFPSATQDEALNEMKKGTYDAIIIDYTMAKSSLNSDEYSNLMIIPGLHLVNEVYAIGFRLHSDMTEKVNEKILEMMNDNSLLELARKYGLEDLYQAIGTSAGKSDSAYIMNNGEIVIAIKEDNKPSSYIENGILKGFDIDYSRTLFNNLGIDVKYTILKDKDWNKKEELLKSEEIDCIWYGIMNVTERSNNVRYKNLIFNNKQAVIANHFKSYLYPDLLSLSGIKIAAKKGSDGAKICQTNNYLKLATLVEIDPSEGDLIQLLKDEVYDVIIVDYTEALKIYEEGIYENMYVIEILDMVQKEYAYSFRQNSDMIKKINDVIKDMIYSGIIYEFEMRYNTNEFHSLVDTTDVLNVIGIGKMIIGIDKSHGPMSYYDSNGELIGFDIEFAKEVCLRLGVEPIFQPIEWNEKEDELRTRNIDCIWSALTVTDERREIMKFSRVYLVNKQIVVINKFDSDKYKTVNNLSNAKISAEIGSTGEEAILLNSHLSHAKYIGSNSMTEALNELIKENYNAVVLDYTVAKSMIGKGDYSNLMIIEDFDLAEEEYGIGFRYGSDLTIKVNNIIEDLMKEKWLDIIAKKYDLTELLRPYYEPHINTTEEIEVKIETSDTMSLKIIKPFYRFINLIVILLFIAILNI